MAIEVKLSDDSMEEMMRRCWTRVRIPSSLPFDRLMALLRDESVSGEFFQSMSIWVPTNQPGPKWEALKTVWFSDRNAAFEFKLKYC